MENQLQTCLQTGTHVSSQRPQLVLQEKLVPSVLVLNRNQRSEGRGRWAVVGPPAAHIKDSADQ